MYALINPIKVRDVGNDRFYESLPDGRLIVPINELRGMGVVEGIAIVPTAREVKEIIKEQKASGLYDTNIEKGGNV